LNEEKEEETLNITQITESVRDSRKGQSKTGKSLSIYLGDGALAVLERIKQFFQKWGYGASESGVVASALTTYEWYLLVKQNPPQCPNPACRDSLTGFVLTCPACGTPIKWIAISP
jgi:hypothetical protein